MTNIPTHGGMAAGPVDHPRPDCYPVWCEPGIPCPRHTSAFAVAAEAALARLREVAA